VTGLLADLEVKTSCQLAEIAGHAGIPTIEIMFGVRG
jgi:hypothetical protein